MTEPRGIWRKTLVLAVAGGLGFWIANFAISRTPIAAEYRAALSISYVPMLLQSLLGGLVIGLGVSYLLLRFFDRIPTKNPILKSLILSFIALVIATIIIEAPSSLLTPTGNAWRYFIIGAVFNALRILALGLVIGCLYQRLYQGSSQPGTAAGAARTEINRKQQSGDNL